MATYYDSHELHQAFEQTIDLCQQSVIALAEKVTTGFESACKGLVDISTKLDGIDDKIKTEVLTQVNTQFSDHTAKITILENKVETNKESIKEIRNGPINTESVVSDEGKKKKIAAAQISKAAEQSGEIHGNTIKT